MSGRVVDEETGAPIEGVVVSLDGPNSSKILAVTGPSGELRVEPVDEWRLFFVVPLLPIEVFPAPRAIWFRAPGDRRYRVQSIAAAFCTPRPWLADRNEEARRINDDLGTIRLKRDGDCRCPR